MTSLGAGERRPSNCIVYGGKIGGKRRGRRRKVNDDMSHVVGDDSEQDSLKGKSIWFPQLMHVFAHSAPREEMKDWIILDSGSSTDVFCKEKYVDGIRKSKKRCEIDTNGGGLSIDTEADVPQYKSVWFDQSSMTNIMGLANVVDKYHVQFDSKIDDAFWVHVSKGRKYSTRMLQKRCSWQREEDRISSQQLHSSAQE